MATILFGIIIIIIRGLTKFIENKILLLQFDKIKSVKLQNLDILTGEQIALVIGKTINWFRYFCYIIIFYLYINLIFSFFPVTRGISAALLAHFIGAVGFVLLAIWNYIPNLLTLIVIFAFGFYLMKLMRRFFKGIEEEKISLSGCYPEWASPTNTILLKVCCHLFPLLKSQNKVVII